ncbi:hypothetical protein KIPB_014279, partial [Kipferlia bialata]|eukprot:g14279.t1
MDMSYPQVVSLCNEGNRSTRKTVKSPVPSQKAPRASKVVVLFDSESLSLFGQRLRLVAILHPGLIR